jgi:hypothetical protein
MNKILRLLTAGALAALLAACAQLPPVAGPSSAPAAAAAGKTEVLWLGQSAFRITTPGGKVIVTDPWLRLNPLTPPEYKKLEALGKVDVLLVTHAHFDHFADAPAIALANQVPMHAPGDMNQAVGLLGILPPNLVPRFNKSGTISPAPGIKVTAVHAEHSSVLVWKNPVTGKDEAHYGGEPVGFIIELENGFSHLPHGGHRPVRRHALHRRLLQARPRADADRRPLHDGACGRRLCHARVAEAALRDPDALRCQSARKGHAGGIHAGPGADRHAGAAAETGGEGELLSPPARARAGHAGAIPRALDERQPERCTGTTPSLVRA